MSYAGTASAPHVDGWSWGRGAADVVGLCLRYVDGSYLGMARMGVGAFGGGWGEVGIDG